MKKKIIIKKLIFLQKTLSFLLKKVSVFPKNGFRLKKAQAGSLMILWNVEFSMLCVIEEGEVSGLNPS